MKKVLSILLCLTTLLSMSVMASSGADEVITSVFFASDAQFYQSYTRTLFGNNTITSCQPVVERLVSLAQEGGHNIETFVFGGDYTQNEASLDMTDEKNQEIFGVNRDWHYGNDPKYTLAYIKETVNDYYTVSDSNMIFLQGNHEPDITKDNNYGLTPMGAYEYDDYIVYVINDQDAAGPRPRCEDPSTQSVAQDANGNYTITQITDPNAVVTATANTLRTYLNGLIEKGDTRPVFIASHQPFYSEREKDSNGEIYLIFDVVNEAAKDLDIIFFFGHTHQKVDNIGGGLSYVEKGDTLYVCDNTLEADEIDLTVDNTATYREETLNFTYMNFGHLARYYGTSNEVLSSTVIDITKDKLILTRYRGKDEDTAAADCVLATYEINRINPAETIPATITGTVDANGEEKILGNNETVTISNSGVLTNGIIDATLGSVNIKGLTVTGRITFNSEGKITAASGDVIKISQPVGNLYNNTFLLSDSVTTSDNSYTVSVKNNTSNNSKDVTFNFDSIYDGNVMFRLNITDVPENADLVVSYK